LFNIAKFSALHKRHGKAFGDLRQWQTLFPNLIEFKANRLPKANIAYSDL